jgi:hypothetical protein
MGRRPGLYDDDDLDYDDDEYYDDDDGYDEEPAATPEVRCSVKTSTQRVHFTCACSCRQEPPSSQAPPKGQAAPSAAAGASKLAHLLCDAPPLRPNGKLQKGGMHSLTLPPLPMPPCMPPADERRPHTAHVTQ